MSCKTANSSCSPEIIERKRRIPGPAGHLYWNLKNDEELVENEEENKNDEELKQDPSCISLSGRILIDRIALESPELWKGAWLTGCIENNIEVSYDEINGKLYILNNNNSFLFSDNIKSIRFNKIEHVFKINELMVLLKTLTVYSDGIGEVIDCFGSMKATFTNKVLSDFIDIRSGSCLVLQNITVYQASHYDFYLNVTNNNISRIYPNNTKIPIQLKSMLKTFHKKLGIKSASQRSIVHKKKKNNNDIVKQTQVRDNNNNIYITSIKRNKKRRYSDAVDTPWLISTSNKRKKRNIYKDNNDKEDSEDLVILPQKNNKNVNKNEDDDVIILSSKNKVNNMNNDNNNDDSDDDIIIKDMDMNETPKHPKQPNQKKKNKYIRKFFFPPMKPRQMDNSDKDKNNSKSPIRSRQNAHYENRENNNDNVNIFENIKENGPIPKDVNILGDLFSQMTDGYHFDDD